MRTWSLPMVAVMGLIGLSACTAPHWTFAEADRDACTQQGLAVGSNRHAECLLLRDADRHSSSQVQQRIRRMMDMRQRSSCPDDTGGERKEALQCGTQMLPL